MYLPPVSVTLEPFTPQRGTEFIEAARRSRRLHRGRVAPPTSLGDYRAYLKRFGERSYGHLIAGPGGELVGVVNLNEIVRGGFQSAYLGYYLFEPFTGRGYMSEALALVLARAFRKYRLHRVEANIQPDNTASIRLVQRLGFRLEGVSPRYLKIGGRWRDHERWALTREEWRGAAPSLPLAPDHP